MRVHPAATCQQLERGKGVVRHFLRRFYCELMTFSNWYPLGGPGGPPCASHLPNLVLCRLPENNVRKAAYASVLALIEVEAGKYVARDTHRGLEMTYLLEGEATLSVAPTSR
jgi:hypothetical protein